MKRYFFVESEDDEGVQEISWQTIVPLVEWIDSVDAKDDAMLHFSSAGGTASAAETVYMALDSKPNIKIHIHHEIYSAAYDVVVRCKNKVIVSPHFQSAMIHKSSSLIDVKDSMYKFPTPSKIALEMQPRLNLSLIHI